MNCTTAAMKLPTLDLRDNARTAQAVKDKLIELAIKFVNEHYVKPPINCIKFLPVVKFREWLKDRKDLKVIIPDQVTNLNKFITFEVNAEKVRSNANLTNIQVKTTTPSSW